MITIRKITDESEKLDLQSLDRQYFFVERPKAVIQELLDIFDTVEDVSYINDETPSVLINGKIKMYLPNSVHLSEMQSNQYVVVVDDEDSFAEGNYYSYDDLNFAIDKVHELLELCDPLTAELKQLEQQAAELLSGGNSSEKAMGMGMFQVIERVQLKLKEINGKL